MIAAIIEFFRPKPIVVEVISKDVMDMISRLSGLIEEVMYEHIYDEANGEKPEHDCVYLNAHVDAECWLSDNGYRTFTQSKEA